MGTPEHGHGGEEETGNANIGNFVDLLNGIIESHADPEVRKHVTVDSLSPNQLGLLQAEGADVGGDEAKRKVMHLLRHDEGTLATVTSVLRAMGSEHAAELLEKAQSEGRDVDDGFIDELDAALLGKKEVIEGAMVRLLDIQKQQAGKMRRGLSGELKAVMRDVGLTTTVRNERRNVGRNDACPCGSGRKYKKCCMNKGR